jgi:hypothetical protein
MQVRTGTRNPSTFRLLLSPQGEGGDTTPSVPDPDPAKAPTADQARKLIDKYGGGEFAVMRLMEEKFQARERIRELEGKLPPAGSLVLSADEAKDWTDYRGLGSVSDIRKVKKDAETASAEVARRTREDHLSSVADAMKIPAENRKAFLKLAVDGEHVIKDEQDDKKQPVKRVYVKVKDGETEKEMPADEAYAEYLPLLRPAATNTQTTTQRSGPPQRPGGRQVPETPNRVVTENAPKSPLCVL